MSAMLDIRHDGNDVSERRVSLVCQHCEGAFEARRSDAKYCSSRCRSAAKRAAEPAAEGRQLTEWPISTEAVLTIAEWGLLPSSFNDSDVDMTRALVAFVEFVGSPEVAPRLAALFEQIAMERYGIDSVTYDPNEDYL